MITCNLVVKAELECPAQQRTDDQGQRRRIGPDNGHIGENQKPGAQKSLIIAKAPFGVGIGSAAIRKTVHQEMIIESQNQHDQGANDKAKGRTHRSCYRQKGAAGHDKGTPADGTAKGQRPCSEGCQIGYLGFLLLKQLLHLMLAPYPSS